MAETLQRPGQQVSLSEQVTFTGADQRHFSDVCRIYYGNNDRIRISFHPLLCRDRVADGRTAESSQSDPRNYSFRFNVQIQRDPDLHSHGLTLTSQTPILVQDITPGTTETMTPTP